MGKGPKGKQSRQDDSAEDLEKVLADLENLKLQAESNPIGSDGHTQPISSSAPSQTPPNPETELCDEDENAAPKDTSKTAKNKLKKLKQKQKKANEAASIDQTENASAKAAPKSVAARAAAEQLRKLKEIQAEMNKQEQEEQRIIEEQKKKEEEEKVRLEEQRKIKREQRNEKRQQLRKDGKLLTAKERILQQKNLLFLEQLKAQGITPPSLESQTSEFVPPHPVPTAVKKKKKWQKECSENEMSECREKQAEGNENDEELSQNSDPVNSQVTNWEDLLSGQEESDEEATETCELQKQLVEKAESTETVSRTLPTGQKKLEKDAPLRSPICCILGHVDTGKTKLLDKLRRTSVQTSEAGGITQQIGATMFPQKFLKQNCDMMNNEFDVRIPGMLVIDTPGHASFNNLRSRGSSLCDIAILVIDLMHGLQVQTKESLQLLRARKCPFLIALNKIDRLYNWNSKVWGSSKESIASQAEATKQEFDSRLESVLLQLQQEGMNCKLYWENQEIRKTVSIIPTSALTAEGLPDLIFMIVRLTQEVMTRSILSVDSFHCTILEKKEIEGLGLTIDVILSDGVLQEGDTIVLCGLSGPIVTSVRALVTPHPMKESRVGSDFLYHRILHASIGAKIAAPGLDDACVGTNVLIAKDNDDIESLKEDVMVDLDSVLQMDFALNGVYAMASTVGSLEALLNFLKESKIPVVGVNIGMIQRKDVRKAGVMRERGYPEYSLILAFDVGVDPNAEKEAKVAGVKLMCADIIYHLVDQFNEYFNCMLEAKKREKAAEAVFPCKLSIIPQYIFNKRDPLIMGVYVDAGVVRIGTPLVVPDKEFLLLGRIISLEVNKKAVQEAHKGQEVCIKIMGEPNIAYGRHFDSTNKLYSRLTRDSIDCLKEHFRNDMTEADWKLVVQLKKIFQIV